MRIQDIMPSLKELVEYDYNDIKTPQYDMLIENYIKKVSSSSSPNFVQISGIPGSGKTTFIEKNNFNKYLYIAFDKVMVSLDGYQQDLKSLGSVEAFKKWEMPARVIGYKILEEAIKNKLNIVLEHSGTNNAHVELFKKLPSIGYKSKINFTMCDINTAVERSIEREKLTKRHTPKEIIEQRYISIQKFLKIYQEFVDVKVYNSYSSGFKLHRTGKK